MFADALYYCYNDVTSTYELRPPLQAIILFPSAQLYAAGSN